MRGLGLTPRCAATPLNRSNTVMRACWENDMSAEPLMYWRVLIYSSDYKHSDLSLTHPQTLGIMLGADTPQLHAAIVHFYQHNGLSGQGHAQNNLYQQCRHQFTATKNKLQYSSTRPPLHLETKLEQGYGSQDHLAAPQTMEMVGLRPNTRKWVPLFLLFLLPNHRPK